MLYFIEQCLNGVQLGMKHNFKKDGENWTADATYFHVTSDGTATYTTNYFTGAPGTPIDLTTVQKTVGTAAPGFLTIQTDYVDPFGASSKLEAGLRASIQHLENDNSTYNVDNNGHDMLDTFSVSNYKSTSQVYAAYLNWTSNIGKNFGYEVGLRGESSRYSGDLLNVDQHFEHNYPLSLFPTLFLSEKLQVLPSAGFELGVLSPPALFDRRQIRFHRAFKIAFLRLSGP